MPASREEHGRPAEATQQADSSAITYFIAAIAALGGLLFGYDTGVISGAQLYLVLDFHLNAMEQELAVSAALIGAVIGAISAGKLNDALGRKRALLLLAVVFFVGSLLTAISPTYWFFLLCRIIVGFGFGAAASVVPVYISEVAPANLRGMLVSFNQLAITIGIAVSYWVDLAFAHANKGWPPMFAVAAIPSFLLFVGMLLVPETPRWLGKNERWDEARTALKRLGRAPVGIERELSDIRQAEYHQERGTLRELLQPGIRMALVVGVGLAVFQQFVGINTVIYYAPTIFQASGVSSAQAAILATSFVGVVNVIFTIVASFVVDRVGRRPLLLCGSAVMVVALVALGVIFILGPGNAHIFVLLALFLYIIAFALSMGPIFWLMSAEIFPTRVRAIGSSVSTFANWLANLIVSITFLSLVAALGQAGTFWLYALIGVLAFIFCLRFVPETKGRSLEEIEYYWQHERHWAARAPASEGE